jgi:hypothetical protein
MMKLFAARRRINIRSSYKKLAMLAIVIIAIQLVELHEISATAHFL